MRAVGGGLLGRLFANDDHTATGVAGRVEAEGVVPWFLGVVTGLGDNPVAFGAAGVGSAGVALVPGGRQARTVDMQPFFAPFYFCLGGRGTASNGHEH